MFGDADEGQARDYAEGRLAFVKAECATTPLQVPLWNKFADAVRASAKSVNERMQPFYRQEWQ